MASPPLFRLAALVSPGSTVEWGKFVGTVKTILPSGAGFVDCPEVFQLHGHDAFIPADVMEQCALSVEDRIRFNVDLERGVSQVVGPVWKDSSHKLNIHLLTWWGQGMHQQVASAFWGKERQQQGQQLQQLHQRVSPLSVIPPDLPVVVAQPVALPQGGQARKVPVARLIPPAPKLEPVIGTQMGTIKTRSVEKGFSTVGVADSQRDVYVPSTIADPAHLQLGDLVAVSVVVEEERLTAEAPLWKLVGTTERLSNPGFGEFIGKVGQSSGDGQVAFMECQACRDMHGEDAWSPRDVMRKCSLEEGDTVSFNVHIDSSGKPQVSIPCWKNISGSRVGA